MRPAPLPADLPRTRRDPVPGPALHASPPALIGAVDRRLAGLAPAESRAFPLNGAVRYALLAPGKRIRPLLAILFYREFGRSDEAVLDPACALEMVHAASLVLDDLPAMDDAPVRRGRPATHVAFGEDGGILAAVALLSLAFGTAAGAERLSAPARARVVSVLAAAIGTDGLAAGQYADLHPRLGALGAADVLDMHARKTGALFVAAAEIAAAVAGIEDGRADRLREAAAELGLAFQILDDERDAAVPGTPGEDDGKATLHLLLGREEARRRLRAHLGAALANLRPGGPLATFVTGLFGPDRAAMPPEALEGAAGA